MDSVERHIEKSIRTFIAVKVRIDDKTIKLLKTIRDVLGSENIRWVKPESFHITLRFIGDTSPGMLILIKDALDKASKQTNHFHFFISGIGVFRNISYPRVLWLGLKQSQELHVLKIKTDETLSSILKIDAQEKYQPHLTIGRMKKIYDSKLLEKVLKTYKNRDFLKVNVEEIIFYESVLLPEGPVYQFISSHSLK